MMTNTTDFFQGQCEPMTLPAAGAIVCIDGVVCEDLTPIEIVRGAWPDFGSARLQYHPAVAADGDCVPYEDLRRRFAMGRSVCVRRLCPPAAPRAGVVGLPIFAGRIEGHDLTMDAQSQRFEITALDFSAVMRRITVYGQHVPGPDGATQFFGGLDTVFNPARQNNAASSSLAVEGRVYRPFCCDAAGAVAWDYASVIAYLLSVYLPGGSVSWPGPEQLGALTEHRGPLDLDLTGLSLLEALQRCCDRLGLAFRLEPRIAETGPAQALVFYRNGQGRAVELNAQHWGQGLSLSRTQIAGLEARRDFYPVTHRYVGQGDFKVYEATFELAKAWDSDLESTTYATFSAATNPLFYQVRDVYRRWCLNEAGDYTDPPYDRGQAHDFTSLFEGRPFVRRRRRFWPTLSADRQGQSLGYFLEVSFDDGLHWRQYTHAFDNLTRECGIRLSSDALDVDTWVAALKGALRFRITASVVSDERLTCVVSNGPVGSAVPVVDHVMTLPRRFAYAKVSSASVLAGADPDTLGTADEADDTDALYEHVRQQAQTSAAIVGTTEIRTPSLLLHYLPGDRVTSSPDSRDLLGVLCDHRSLGWIENVGMDFNNQQTRLKLAWKRR